MRRSSRVILLLGIFLAVGAFIVIAFFGGGRGQTAATPTPPMGTYIVAAVDIPQGTQIQSSMLTTKTVLLTDVPADAITLSVDQVIGKTARQAVAAGAYVPQSAVFQIPGQLDIPGQLKAGERAMAVQVDEVSGVGTLIQRGDYVDVIVAFTGDEIPVNWVIPAGVTASAPTVNGSSVKLIIQNLRVVTTLLPVSQAAQGAQGAAAGTPAPSAPTLSGRSEVVILAVTAQQAEVLRFARLAAAPVTLVLRATADEGASPAPPVTTTGVVLKTMIDEYGVLPPKPVTETLPPELAKK